MLRGTAAGRTTLCGLDPVHMDRCPRSGKHLRLSVSQLAQCVLVCLWFRGLARGLPSLYWCIRRYRGFVRATNSQRRALQNSVL